MILVLALWLVVIGYAEVFLGLDKLSSNRKGYSFGQVFFPDFLLGGFKFPGQASGGNGIIPFTPASTTGPPIFGAAGGLVQQGTQGLAGAASALGQRAGAIASATSAIAGAARRIFGGGGA